MGVCGVHPEIVWKTLTQKLLFHTQIQFATLKIQTRADGKAFLHLGYFFSSLLLWRLMIEKENYILKNLLYISHCAYIVAFSNRSMR